MATTPTSYSRNRRPIRIGYGLAGLVVIVGMVVGATYGVVSIGSARSAPDDFERTVVGGSLTVDVEVTGPMAIYSVEGAAWQPP